MRALGDVRFRRREPEDMADAFRVFYRSMYDYFHRVGLADAATAENPPIEANWPKRRAWWEHLTATAAEDWVAVDEADRIIGWAQSVEREGLLDLTMFMVDPTVQSRGIGRGLLERAFPLGRGDARTINASQDPRALGLYFRFGVAFATSSAEFKGAARPSDVVTDLAIERVDPGMQASAAPAIVALERELLGHGRAVDTRFLLGDRPAWLARRNGQVVGMAFGASGEAPAAGISVDTGPVGALEPADVPALLATVESDAASRGFPEIGFTVPLANSTAVRHLLNRGLRMDPGFYAILSSDSRIRFDRWVHTRPEYIV
jgi:GNAT superfamily N-acetyltransferase